jgi:ornithine carbamoyltransferase
MQHFLHIDDLTKDALLQLLDGALELKQEFKKNGNRPLLSGKSLGMLFMKPSLRTRVSFEMAMQHVGGHAVYLGPSEVGLGQRESIKDVAQVLGSYVDAIMARVFDHEHILELAQYSPVPVINGLSDFNHPCQALADALTIKEEFGKLEGIKIAYIGDSNNVTRSLLFLARLADMHISVASPEGYTLDEASIRRADYPYLETVTDPAEAVRDAHVIYTDTWVSMGQEEETVKRRAVFPPYQVNESLLNKAESNAIVLHCLPAHRGDEITDAVADGEQSRIYQQAENRLHAQKALLVRLLG